MNNRKLTEWTRENWYRIDKAKREEIVAMLRKELNMDSFRIAMQKNPYGWPTKDMWHFGQGMQVRNLLREKGFTDDQLPPVPYEIALEGGGSKHIEEVRNWDDFYTAALEAAARVIDV